MNVQCTAVFDDGSGPALYVGGTFTTFGGVSASHVAKWNGTSGSALGAPGSGTNGTVFSLAVFDDGSGPALYVGGQFTTAGGVSALRIAKWNGTSWSALGSPGSGMNSSVDSLAVFDDGSGPALYAGGQFTTASGVSALRIAKWNGTIWSALGSPGSGMNSAVTSFAVFDDGSGPALYVGGLFATAGGVSAPCIAKWNGTNWSALGAPGSGTNSYVASLVVFDDGSGPALYAGGPFAFAGGVFAPYIAKWNGTSWSALGSPGSGINGSVYSLTVFDDGSGPALYAGGVATTAGGGAAPYIAKWNGTSWSALGGPGTGYNDWVLSLAGFDDGSGPALYAGGIFTTAGGVPASCIAKWDGSSWSALGSPGGGMNNPVNCLAVFDDGSGPALHAGGDFTVAGGVSAPYLARWSGTSWSALGSPGSGMNDRVFSLAVCDDGSGPALYAGGDFTTAGGVAASRIARWNGTSWSALGAPGSGINSWVNSLVAFDDGSGPALYAGGLFTTAGGVSALRIAKWNGTSWSALGSPGSGMNSKVNSLAVFDDGSGPALYAGGEFTSAGGVSALRIAKWNGTSWSALGSPGSGMNDVVNSLAVYDDGSGPALYAGGEFRTAGGIAARFIAKWNGTSWSPLGFPLSGSNTFVSSLAVFDDGFGPALYAGGQLTNVSGGIARWNGTSWSALGSLGGELNGAAKCLAGFDDGSGPALFAGGDFTAASNIESAHIAAWHSCPNVPHSFCSGDGSGSACPCGNVALTGRGCDNSSATGGAFLTDTGTTAPDTLVLTQSGELASSFSIFLQGSLGLATPVVFGDGLRCAGGSLKRLYFQSASAGAVSAPQPGDPSISARSAALGDPLSPGAVRFYQVYYRDPDPLFCPAPSGDTFNVGNALRVVW